MARMRFPAVVNLVATLGQAVRAALPTALRMALPLAISAALAGSLGAGLGGCATSHIPGQKLPRTGREIIVGGERIYVGVPVVLWTDPEGYDGYRVQRRFARPGQGEWAAIRDALPSPNRYGDRPGPPDRRSPSSWTAHELARTIDQFVVHYDAAGTARQCFRILHDVRGLSVHFLLDIDGTIYQTLDVKERAWHATIANDRSVGVEIAHIGAYPPGSSGVLDRWYARDEHGWRITLPPESGDGGVLTPGFVGRPARDGPIEGRINGTTLIQHDFTPQQYESLSHLIAALSAVLPSISLDAPRGSDGAVLDRALTPEEFAGFRGVLGHWHVQANKVDPGPAFDWDRVLTRARSLRRRAPTRRPHAGSR